MLFDAEGVHPYPEKAEAIRAIQVPQDAQELQSFLGIATYMAPFFPNLFALSKPLSNLLKMGTNFYLSTSHSTAFEKIKQSICRQVSLTYFDLRRKILQVDISLRGLGSALVQEGKVVPLHLDYSRTLRNDLQILSVRCLLLLLHVRNFTPTCLARIRSQTF